MKKTKNVGNTAKFKRSIKAISPVIATLLMIAIAVVASLVVYAWVTGYMGTTTSKAGKAIQIQSYAPTGTDPLNPTSLLVYVQNVGQGDVQISQAQSVYIDSNLVSISAANPAPTAWPLTLSVGQTVELTVPLPPGYVKGDTLNIKVTTTDGTFMTATGAGTSTTNSAGSGNTASITLGQTSGTAGSTVTLSGSNFAATSVVTVKFDTTTLATTPATVTTTAAGAIPSGVAFTVPASASTGSHTITVTDASSNSATSTFTVSTVVVPAITLNPTTGPATTTVTVSGTGFAATSAMNIKFNGVTQTATPATVTTSATGTFSCTFNIPAIAAGGYTVLATDASSGSASSTFTVTAVAAIVLNPTSGHVGDTVTITASGMRSSHSVTATFGATAVTLSSSTTDVNGALTATFTVPTSTPGSITVTLTDGINSPTATFTSSSVTTTISPSSSAGNGWTNPTRAYASDGSYATANSNGAAERYGYSFSIPAGASITQIRVRTDGYVSNNDHFRIEISTNAGTSYLATTDEYGPNVGSVTTHWTDATAWTTWTPTILNSGNVLVRITQVQQGSGADNVYLDWLPIEVTYS